METKNDVTLKEAMSYANRFVGVVWSVEGNLLDIEELQYDTASVQYIMIMKTPNKPYSLNAFVEKRDGKTDFKILDEISTMKELESRYPQLFEMEGSMITL